MAENRTAGAKKLKMDNGDFDKNADFFPPIFKSEKGAKDDCDNCKVYKASNKNLVAKISDLQGDNEQLRVVIKDLLMKTGEDPENFHHLLSPGQRNKNLSEDTKKNLAVQQALSTSVVRLQENLKVLRKVFGHFDDPNLLQFRRVCKFWAEEASAYLLIFKDPSTYQSWDKVPPAQVRLSYNSAENTLGKNGVGTVQNLVKLMKSGLKAGRKFPCSHFSLTCPNLLPAVVPDAVELLEKFGYLMESLVLEFVNLPNSTLTNRDIVECLQNVLFKWAPNLKYFFFKVEQWPQDGDPVPLLNDENFSSSLPNLQILGWYNTGSSELLIYREILRISPNLKILNYPPMEEVIQAKKTDAIKQIQVYFSSVSPALASRLALSSEHCFKLEKIKMDYFLYQVYDRNTKVVTFPEDWKTNVQLLNKVLYNNRDSLTKLECQNLGPLSEIGLQVPVMSNLKTLDITTDFESKLISAGNVEAQNFFRIFPKGLDVPKAFPKLAHISWNIKIREDMFNPLETPNVFLQIPVLDTMGPLTSVRSLTFHIVEKKNVGFLERIAVCLPNVRKLTVDYNERFCISSLQLDCIEPAFPKILRIIWDLFQGLEEIHLLPYLKDAPNRVFLKETTAQLLDSAITGLDLATVKRLAGKCSDNVKFGETSKNLEDIPEKDPDASSILNMKRLRYLKISVQSLNDFPILSHVSGTHGFGLMSNLAVVIEAKGEKSSVIDDPSGLMSSNVKFTQMARKRKYKW